MRGGESIVRGVWREAVKRGIYSVHQIHLDIIFTLFKKRIFDAVHYIFSNVFIHRKRLRNMPPTKQLFSIRPFNQEDYYRYFPRIKC